MPDASRCDIPCDDDCEADCHQAHLPRHKRHRDMCGCDQRGEPVEIVFTGALANPTIEVVYERFGDIWRATSPQVAHLVDHDSSFDALDARVRARMAEWARPEVHVTYTTRSEGARDA